MATASCSSPSPGGPAGVLKVTAMDYGGPATSNGGTPAEPAGADFVIKVAGEGTSLRGLTDGSGVVTFRLTAGLYHVSSPTCGITGSVKVTVRPARSTSLTWVCPIP